MTHTPNEMSNLITDMTIAGATEDELRRAVSHSMLVMDCSKYVQRSAEHNGIDKLVDKYRGTRIVKDERITKAARRMLTDGRYTIKEVAEILEVSEDSIREALEGGANDDV